MPRTANREPVKVVIINTEYVKTDATSFKSVVQRLTGKDAPSSPNKKLSGVCGGGGGGNDGGNSRMLTKGMSFRDLDKYLLELPTMDDIYRICVD
ncbi:hypothetical protein SSX86_024225 [Deinandra increscens subsp. villosa]|uniref:VQ domain-containing protein n=1 Tax=Deinandra increscens subsp. villosa TaxID=3103831 RepID=A0AAP0CHL2_9ASTR